MMFYVQGSVFLVLLSLAAVYGATSRADLDTVEEYGKTVKFCKYKGLRMLPRSTFKDLDTCMKCVCTRGGLSCATLSTAFTVFVPDDTKCTSVRVGCRNRWVWRNEKTKRCPRRLIPKEISMVGK